MGNFTLRPAFVINKLKNPILLSQIIFVIFVSNILNKPLGNIDLTYVLFLIKWYFVLWLYYTCILMVLKWC